MSEQVYVFRGIEAAPTQSRQRMTNEDKRVRVIFASRISFAISASVPRRINCPAMLHDRQQRRDSLRHRPDLMPQRRREYSESIGELPTWHGFCAKSS